MEPIKDLDTYNARMRKSMYDKLWFVDKLPDNISCLYDYGCGDGTLLSMAKTFLPHIETIGYDNNTDMRKLAIEAGVDTVMAYPLEKASAGTCLVASSVFHEIYNYAKDVEKERQNIFGIGADYIAIRDMMYDDLTYPKASRFDVARIRQGFFNDKAYMLEQFEAEYGSIDNYKNFIHFLLKYRYVENWNKELKENYFPYSLTEFFAFIPDNYEVVHFEHYPLPYLQKRVKEDFDIDLIVEKTHMKLLLKRVK